MKKDIRLWAVKLRGRSFYSTKDRPIWTFNTRAEALVFAEGIMQTTGIKAAPARVRIRMEEVS